MTLFSPLAIAPMIDWTYSHFRVFMRLLAPHALLYTDMKVTGAILHQTERMLAFHPVETPLALQVGGADLEALVHCAKLAEQYGYSEINLNLGCPSDRVLAGRFGACLMAEPAHVSACIRAMKAAVTIPVTAKTRIGIDHQDSYAFFEDFASALIEAGCDKLIVHARKAWLTGLSPKQNRTIPPLHYEYVYRLKARYPHVSMVINGQIQTIEAIKTHLEQVDGVMLGRLAYQHPFAIAACHHALYPAVKCPTRYQVLQAYLAYAASLPPTAILSSSLLLKPLYTLAHGLPFARAWKAKLMAAQCVGTMAAFQALHEAWTER